MIRLGVLCTILVVLGLGVAGCSPDTATHPQTTNKQSTTKSSTATSTVRSTTTTDSEEALARAVLDKMTVRQKASQVLLLMFSGTTTISDELTKFLNETPPGGLMLFSKNVKSKAQVTALNTLLQKNARKGLPGVSMFIAADQEGGDVQRIREGVPDVPAARTVGTKWTPQKAGEVATQTAKGLRAQGVNMDLSPVADVVNDKTFLFPRSFSGKPEVVAEFVSAITKAYTKEGVITLIKHFPGHGSATGNSHVEPIISDDTKKQFETIHLVPFKAGIKAGAEGVVVGHILAKAYDSKNPATSSTKIIGTLLRRDLGFKGLVVSDAVEMLAARLDSGKLGSATPQEAGDTAVACLKAGCDLLMSTTTLARELVIVDTIEKAVEDGELPLARLNQAVLRILELKAHHGLLK
jgi:beta-N-acetylhexosaminidase